MSKRSGISKTFTFQITNAWQKPQRRASGVYSPGGVG